MLSAPNVGAFLRPLIVMDSLEMNKLGVNSDLLNLKIEILVRYNELNPFGGESNSFHPSNTYVRNIF